MRRRRTSLPASLIIALRACPGVTPPLCAAAPAAQGRVGAANKVPGSEGVATTLHLCRLLAGAEAYEGKVVRVLAYYTVGGHEAYLYGPGCEQEAGGAGPPLSMRSLVVGFDKGVEGRTRPDVWDTFSHIVADYKRSASLRRRSRIQVSFVGRIEGRRCEGCGGGARHRFRVDGVEGVWLEPTPDNAMHPTADTLPLIYSRKRRASGGSQLAGGSE